MVVELDAVVLSEFEEALDIVRLVGESNSRSLDQSADPHDRRKFFLLTQVMHSAESSVVMMAQAVYGFT